MAPTIVVVVVVVFTIVTWRRLFGCQGMPKRMVWRRLTSGLLLLDFVVSFVFALRCDKAEVVVRRRRRRGIHIWSVAGALIGVGTPQQTDSLYFAIIILFEIEPLVRVIR